MKIKTTHIIYISLSIILCISIVLIFLFWKDTILRRTFSIPGILALFGFMYQSFRDRLTHERQLSLQREQNYYTLSISSHMANKAFDKHVDFCEEYISEIRKMLTNLFPDSDKSKVMDYAENLKGVRINNIPWVTKEINDKLKSFENKLTSLGAKWRNHQVQIGSLEQKLSKGKEINDAFGKLFGYKIKENTAKEEYIDTVEFGMQELLGINELTKLRQQVLSEAMKTLNS